MKILRFDDDQIGVIKNDNMVVDVSSTISARKAKGPQRVMEEVIEGWRKYRKRFEKVLAEQEGVPLASVQLRSPLARPGKCLAAFSNYIDRPERTADKLGAPHHPASGDIEHRHIAKYIVHGFFLRHVFGGLADHEGELRLGLIDHTGGDVAQLDFAVGPD